MVGPPGDPTAVETALRHLKGWCILAPQFTRKAHHSSLSAKDTALVPDAALDAAVNSLPPVPVPLITDEQLDLQESGQGEAKPRPRRKAQAKVVGDAEHQLAALLRLGRVVPPAQTLHQLNM